MSYWPRNNHKGWWLGWFCEGMDECLRLAVSTRHLQSDWGEKLCRQETAGKQCRQAASKAQGCRTAREPREESGVGNKQWSETINWGDTEHLRQSVYVVTICYLWDASRGNEPHVKLFKFSGAKTDSSRRLMFWNSLVAKLCPTFCDLMDCSMPGFPVLYHLLEFAQTHVHWVSDVTQPSHSVSTPLCLQSFSASGSFPLSQLFTSGGHSIGASLSVLPMNILGRVDFL